MSNTPIRIETHRMDEAPVGRNWGQYHWAFLMHAEDSGAAYSGTFSAGAAWAGLEGEQLEGMILESVARDLEDYRLEEMDPSLENALASLDDGDYGLTHTEALEMAKDMVRGWRFFESLTSDEQDWLLGQADGGESW